MKRRFAGGDLSEGTRERKVWATAAAERNERKRGGRVKGGLGNGARVSSGPGQNCIACQKYTREPNVTRA